jgi:PAS domain S-box-containing protein
MNIDEISKGKLDVNLESSEISEINNLTDSLNRVMASLKLAITKVGVKKGEIFEEAVKAKETVTKKYEDIIDSITGWAWETDEKGDIKFCSKNVSKNLGYTPEEMIGKSIFEFLTPEDAKRIKSTFIDLSKNKNPISNLENWNVKKNGSKVCFVTNAFPFFDSEGNLLGYRGVDTDITKEKIAYYKIHLLNKELEEVKNKINTLLNKRNDTKESKTSIQDKDIIEKKWSEDDFDSVYLFDENANILDCNENMEKRLGYSRDEMLSFNMADFDALESQEGIFEKINQAKKNGFYSFKTIHKKKDGSSILVYQNIQYIKDKNQFKCIVREDIKIDN